MAVDNELVLLPSEEEELHRRSGCFSMTRLYIVEFFRVLGVSGIVVAFSIVMLSALFLRLFFSPLGRKEELSASLSI